MNEVSFHYSEPFPFGLQGFDVELWNGVFVLGLGGSCYSIYVCFLGWVGVGSVGRDQDSGSGTRGAEVVVYRHDLLIRLIDTVKVFFYKYSTLEYA